MTVLQNLILIGVSGCIMGASWHLVQAARSVNDSARSLVAVGESLTASAKNLGLSSQRLIGEAALLNINALRRDADLPYPDEKFEG